MADSTPQIVVSPSLPSSMRRSAEIRKGESALTGSCSPTCRSLSRCEAVEKLEWYAQGWRIKIFHKILKSGCKAEESRLRTAERLANLVAVLCILSWRIFWLTMINRIEPETTPATAFTELELHLLDTVIGDKPSARTKRKSLSAYVLKLAKLGGYLARAHGMTRLTDIELGAIIGARLVGN